MQLQVQHFGGVRFGATSMFARTIVSNRAENPWSGEIKERVRCCVRYLNMKPMYPIVGEKKKIGCECRR